MRDALSFENHLNGTREEGVVGRTSAARLLGEPLLKLGAVLGRHARLLSLVDHPVELVLLKSLILVSEEAAHILSLLDPALARIGLKDGGKIAHKVASVFGLTTFLGSHFSEAVVGVANAEEASLVVGVLGEPVPHLSLILGLAAHSLLSLDELAELILVDVASVVGVHSEEELLNSVTKAALRLSIVGVVTVMVVIVVVVIVVVMIVVVVIIVVVIVMAAVVIVVVLVLIVVVVAGALVIMVVRPMEHADKPLEGLALVFRLNLLLLHERAEAFLSLSHVNMVSACRFLVVPLSHVVGFGIVECAISDSESNDLVPLMVLEFAVMVEVEGVEEVLSALVEAVVVTLLGEGELDSAGSGSDADSSERFHSEVFVVFLGVVLFYFIKF